MARHVMECLGKARVVIEDGKVLEVGEPQVKYCPLFEKYRGIKELTPETVRENMEYRIRTFGMCSQDRATEMDDFISFGVSEILSHSITKGDIDAAVIAADGCGTAVMTDPRIIQGMGGRISGLCETEPIPKVVAAVGAENMLDPDTARMDAVAGADKAFAMGYKTVAVTTPFVSDAIAIRERHGSDAVIVGVHTTGMSREDAERAFETFDIITACASKNVRGVASERKDILIAGTKVPIIGITPKGKAMVTSKLDSLGMKPQPSWSGMVPPDPLVRRRCPRYASRTRCVPERR